MRLSSHHAAPDAQEAGSRRAAATGSGDACRTVRRKRYVTSTHADDLYHDIVCIFEWEASIDTHKSSLKGAMVLKFAIFCSS